MELITRMITQREPLYRLADLSIPTDGRSVNSIAFELETVLATHVMSSVELAMRDRLVAESDDLWQDAAFGREGWQRRYPYPTPPER